MRILVVGAGGIGGYFGGRLAAAGRDVTFLVRDRRAAHLAETGLQVRSPRGDVRIDAPRTVTAGGIGGPYDLVVLSCKAFDLEAAMDSFAPAVGSGTAILPLLNGMRHLDMLDARFGDGRALGGQCLISAVLASDGTVRHLNDTHVLGFGERDGSLSDRVTAIADTLTGAGFDAVPSRTVVHDMWEKWIFIATAAGITSLMRAAIGDIVAAGAADLATGLYDECAAIASSHGFAPRAEAATRAKAMMSAPGSPLTASLARDIEQGSRIEADHVVGDLLRRADTEPTGRSVLRIAYAHLKAYEARRAREAPH